MCVQGSPAEARVPLSPQDIAPLEFALRDSRVSLAIAGAAISPPMVPKGAVCREVKVFPAECRGLRSTYRGKITVRFSSTPFFFQAHRLFGVVPGSRVPCAVLVSWFSSD